MIVMVVSLRDTNKEPQYTLVLITKKVPLALANPKPKTLCVCIYIEREREREIYIYVYPNNIPLKVPLIWGNPPRSLDKFLLQVVGLVVFSPDLCEFRA